jgi:glycosyltransferase involved in cell wall biosynthesis
VGTRTILYASYVSPFPPHSGERIRALNLIFALRALGYQVEAVVGNYEGIHLAGQSQDGVRFHQIPFAWPRLRQATSTYFRANQAFVEQIRTLHQADALSAIVLDYGFMGAQIAALSELGVPVVLGTHNLESALTGQVPKTSLAAKAAIRLRQAIEYAHERLFFGRADAMLCVSEEDRRAYARFLPEDRLHVVPNFIDIPDRYSGLVRENRIIMTGSFSNFQNVDGLRWFMNEVWDESLSSRTSLCVGGKLSDHATREFVRIPGVTGLGTLDDMLEEVARSRCAIVPLWHGGGTRLKCIEAMATCTPVVTTSKGCEGILHDGAFRVADTAAAFRAAIGSVLDDPAKAAEDARMARAIFDAEYSLPANAARLERALESAKRVCAARAEDPERTRGALHAAVNGPQK